MVIPHKHAYITNCTKLTQSFIHDIKIYSITHKIKTISFMYISQHHTHNKLHVPIHLFFSEKNNDTIIEARTPTNNFATFFEFRYIKNLLNSSKPPNHVCRDNTKTQYIIKID